MAPRKRLMRGGGVADLSGSWSLAERHGMDEFLQSIGFNGVQRAAVLRAGQVQIIRRVGSDLHIVTRDVRGTSELVLPLDGAPVSGEGDGDTVVARRAYTEADAVVITETVAGSSEPLSVCRRSLQQDGRMCVDVRKRNKHGETAHMRIVFCPVGNAAAQTDAM